MLIATKLREEDLSARVAWMLDKEVYQKMPVPYPAKLSDTLNWYKGLEAKKDVRIDFSVIAEDVGQVVGFMGLVNYKKQSNNAEFYIFLNPKHTGKGYGSLMMKWLVNYSFSIWNLHKFYCYTIANNEGANTFYKRIGFEQEGHLVEHLHFRGQYVDRNIFGLLRSKWEALPWQKQVQLDTKYIINK